MPDIPALQSLIIYIPAAVGLLVFGRDVQFSLHCPFSIFLLLCQFLFIIYKVFQLFTMRHAISYEPGRFSPSQITMGFLCIAIKKQVV